MTRSWRLGICLAVASVTLLLAAGGSAADDPQDRAKSKAQDKGPSTTVTIDLSKLPPELARQLLEFALGAKSDKAAQPRKMEARPKAEKGKAEKGKADKAQAVRLPPGLAKKPPTHPGRINWLKAHGLTDPDLPPAKKAKGKKGSD